MKTVKLFELKFTDNTELLATMDDNNNILFTTIGKGINLIIKNDILDRIDKNRICSFVDVYDRESKYVKSYTDFVNLRSNEMEKELLKAL